MATQKHVNSGPSQILGKQEKASRFEDSMNFTHGSVKGFLATMPANSAQNRLERDDVKVVVGKGNGSGVNSLIGNSLINKVFPVNWPGGKLWRFDIRADNAVPMQREVNGETSTTGSEFKCSQRVDMVRDHFVPYAKRF